MADSPELRYVINTTLGKLDGLKTIQTQIIALQKLANEGADFGIRINPTALDGIRKTVATAVADGVAMGGGKGGQTWNSGGGSGAAVGDLGAVLMELKKAAAALSTLASSRRAPDSSPEQRESGYTSASHGAVRQQLERHGDITEILKQAKKINGQNDPADKLVKDILEVVQTGLPHLKKETQREIKKDFDLLKKAFDNALNEGEQENAAYAMEQHLKRFLSTLKERDRRIKEVLNLDNRHYDAGALNDEHRTARPPGTGSRVSGAGAFAIDQAQLNAAFTSAADAFGQRLMAYLPGGGGGGGGGIPVGVIGGAQPGMIFSQGTGALPRKVCSRCGGTGQVKNGNRESSICFKCGGSGDENHPNVGAAVSAGAEASKVGNFYSNPITGTANNPIIPHSVGRREEIIQEMIKLEQRRRDPVYSMLTSKENMPDLREQERIDERMQQINEEFSKGGVPRGQFYNNPRVQEGMLVSQAELAKMTMDPTFKPTQATGTGKFNLGDPMIQTAEHINLLTGAIENLNKVNLSKVGDTFTKLSSELGRLATDMAAVSTVAQKVGGQDMELNYTKLLNSEKERHATTISNIKNEVRDQREAERVSKLSKRILQADRLSGIASGMTMPSGAFDADRIEVSLDRRFRKLGRITTRAEDLEFEANALSSQGISGGANAQSRIGNIAQFMGARSGLFKELQRAAIANPQKYDYLLQGPDNINTVVRNEARVQEAQAALRSLSEARGQLAAMTDRSSKKGILAAGPAFDTARDTVRSSIGRLSELGIITNNDVNKTEIPTTELKKRVAEETSMHERQAQSIMKLAGARHEEHKALMVQGEGWERFTRKFRDLMMYMAAGTMIYSAINIAQRAVQEAAKFEGDMADIQGIFVAKTRAQRDAVMGGIMQGAVDFGVTRSAAAGTAKTFAQTGLNPARTIEMMRASLLAQRGAGLDSAQATEMLIAVDNLTKGAVHPTDIIDRISRVEARHAVTAQDLSTIIQRAGPMAAHLQPDMLGSTDSLDMLMGMGTSLIEKTRVTGSSAGTTLKFLMARLSAPGVQKKLQNDFGVMLGERNSGEMRQMTDIFGDIAGKYTEFKQSGQTGKAASLLTTFAGARQANAAAAIFDDWKKTMDVAQESSLAFGDSQRRLAIQMDTLQAKTAAASSAFSNFTSTFLQSSGLMDVMKLALSGATHVFQAGANHPLAAPLVQAGGLLGIGGLLKMAGPALSGQWGMLGMLGKMAPVLSSVATGAGILAAGGAAYALTDKFLHGDENARQKQAELYGPAQFDRSVYDQSEQGIGYGNTAKKYGMSSLGLYTALAQASAKAHEAAVAKFGEAGANSEHNPKLARFLEEEMVKQLEKILPGFKDIADESEKTATALQMLRQSMQYGGVGNYAQQGDFQEKTQSALQELQSNMLKNPSSILQDVMGRAYGPYYLPGKDSGYGLRIRTNARQGAEGADFMNPADKWKYVNYSDIGMGYNTGIARLLKHNTVGDMRLDAKNILNAMQPNLGLGMAFGSTHMTGGGTILSNAVDLMRTGKSLGQALDQLADSIENVNKKDVDAIKLAKEKGTVTEADLKRLNRGENFNALVGSMKTSLHVGLSMQERMEAAGLAAPNVGGLATGGGKMIDKVLDAARVAAEAEMRDLDPKSDAAKRIGDFLTKDLAAGNRQKTRLDVLGAMSGVNLRQYLKDKVMDEFLRYGERQGAIGLSSKYLAGTGIAYDATAERAAASTQALQGFIQVSSQLPMDEIRAAHRLEMASGAGVDGAGLLTDEGDVTESTRSVLSTLIQNRIKKNALTGKGGENKQIDQLAIQLQAIKRAGLEWSSGSPNELFDHLAPKYKKTLANIMKLKSVDELAGFGITQQDAVLALLTAITTTDIGLQSQKQMGLQSVQGKQQRRGLNLGHYYALKNAGVSSALAIEMAKGDDQSAIMDLRKQMVEAGRATSVGMANSQYQGSMASILHRAGGAGGFAADGTLTGTFAVEAHAAAEELQTAVLQANNDAQKNMLELLNDAHLDFVKNAEAHYDMMQKGITDPFVKVLSDPYSLLGSKKGGEIATAVGGFANQKLAEAAIDNLVGPEGVFGEKFGNLFKNPMYEGAHLLRQAHVDGIQAGARILAGLYGGVAAGAAGATGGADGLPSAGATSPGSLLGSGVRVAAAGIGAIIRFGKHQIRIGTSDAGEIRDAKQAAKDAKMANVMGDPNMGIHTDENGNSVIVGAMGGVANLPKSKKYTQGQMAAIQIATLAVQMGSAAIFGKRDKATGMPTNYGVEGSQIGTMVGGMIPGLGPFGAAIGAVVGGFLGSLFHRRVPKNTPEYEALAKIERNTREAVDAISNQTRSLLSPENRLLYSPSTFAMPGMQPFASGSSAEVAGGQANVKIEVNINAGDRSAADLAAEIAGHLQSELVTIGTFTNPRF